MRESADHPTTAAPPDQSQVFRDTLRALLDNQAKVLTDVRGAEDSTRQVYSDRFLFELLQNARDAAARGDHESPRALFLLTIDALIVANDGAPFDRDGYEAITGIGQSRKGGAEPSEGPRLIGRKGIGFKSVLRVSQRPQVFGRTRDGGRLAVEFGAPRIRSLCAAAAAADESALRGLLSADEREWFEQDQGGRALASSSLVRSVGERGVGTAMLLDRLPVMLFPLWVDEPPSEIDRLLDDEGFDTVIRLPLDREGLDEVRARLRDDIVPEKLLFLGVLARVEVEDESGDTADRWSIDAARDRGAGHVTLTSHGIAEHLDGAQVYRLFERDVDVELPDGERELRQVQVAVPIEGTRVVPHEAWPLFNYYPIVDEGEVLPLLVHAEFEVDPGRTKFSPDHPQLNLALLDAIAEVLTGEGIYGDGSVLGACLDGSLDATSAVPMLLVPHASERELVGSFRERMIERLVERPCIPCADGQWRRPSDTRGGEHSSSAEVVFGADLAGIEPALVSSEARDQAGFATVEDALGLAPFGIDELQDLLDTDVMSACADPRRFGALYDLIDDIAASADIAPEAIIDRYRPDGDGPRVGLLPCPTVDSGLKVEPLPYRRKAGGQTAEEQERSRHEVRIYHRSAGEALDWAPPNALRLRFLDASVLDDATQSHRRAFVEDVLDVRAYDTNEVLRRLVDVDYEALGRDGCAEVARFILMILCRRGLRVWSVIDNVEAGHVLRPERFFAGFPRADEETAVSAAREALTRIHLPCADGSLRAGDDMRFTDSWGPQYAALGALDPPSAAPIAAPDVMVAYLGAEEIAMRLEGERREPLESAREDGRLPEGEASAESRALVHAFLRMAGVWETLPLGHVPALEQNAPGTIWPLKRLATLVPEGERLVEDYRARASECLCARAHVSALEYADQVDMVGARSRSPDDRRRPGPSAPQRPRGELARVLRPPRTLGAVLPRLQEPECVPSEHPRNQWELTRPIGTSSVAGDYAVVRAGRSKGRRDGGPEPTLARARSALPRGDAHQSSSIRAACTRGLTACVAHLRRPRGPDARERTREPLPRPARSVGPAVRERPGAADGAGGCARRHRLPWRAPIAHQGAPGYHGAGRWNRSRRAAPRTP